MENRIKDKLAKEAVVWLKHFSQLSGQMLFFFEKTLKNGVLAVLPKQLNEFSQVHQKFLQDLALQHRSAIHFKTRYWQELYFLWQRFMLNKQEVDKNSRLEEAVTLQFIKDFYLLHVRHFQGMLMLAEGLDKNKTLQMQDYLQQIIETCLLENFNVSNLRQGVAVLEKCNANLLKCLELVLNKSTV